MQSPMVEFRRRRSGLTLDPSSPRGAQALSEEEVERLEERLERRAEVMQKVAQDYAKVSHTPTSSATCQRPYGVQTARPL